MNEITKKVPNCLRLYFSLNKYVLLFSLFNSHQPI
jgi:hypothetical protein